MSKTPRPHSHLLLPRSRRFSSSLSSRSFCLRGKGWHAITMFRHFSCPSRRILPRALGVRGMTGRSRGMSRLRGARLWLLLPSHLFFLPHWDICSQNPHFWKKLSRRLLLPLSHSRSLRLRHSCSLSSAMVFGRTH